MPEYKAYKPGGSSVSHSYARAIASAAESSGLSVGVKGGLGVNVDLGVDVGLGVEMDCDGGVTDSGGSLAIKPASY